ncbi:hypothetical protein B0H17DRAFT_323450 [Mycena rosella]|uniref:Uncharacterized protein n=1 Tax=Mycena rosella TaxID=1033263 RepID=A0AAD7DS89_MYCRO|nr:hypothetical protein B0H17DRAFT_323450 [Mycena rosella]
MKGTIYNHSNSTLHDPIMQKTSTISERKSNASQILEYARLAAATARDLAEAPRIPFLQTAAGASLLVLDEIKTMKMNQGAVLRIAKLIQELLYVIINLCVVEEGVLPVKVLEPIGNFAEYNQSLKSAHVLIPATRTLQAMRTSLRFQQELGKLKRFIRQHEISGQLREYEAELQTILDDLKMKDGVHVAAQLVEFELDAQQRHKELMSLLAARNDASSSEYSASFRGSFLHHSNSSSVFSVLPPVPKIFHGRHSELEQIVTTVQVVPSHMVILGPGGMGKTTLAIATLHHPEVISKYERRYFISCESAFQKAAFDYHHELFCPMRTCLTGPG